MINQVIQLVKPKTFEIKMQDIKLLNNSLIIRPTYLSICHADQRYYKGARDKAVLQQKLPMALIHEAVGEVQYDPLKEFNYGEKVVMIPNIPGSFLGYEKSISELNEKIGENYCPNARFRSSGYDGFMQELIAQPRELVIRAHDSIHEHLLSITELLSVCTHAFKRFQMYSHGFNDVIGVWGDGNIAFLMSLLLKKSLPNSKIIVFGKHSEKLEMFSFVDETYLIHENIDAIKVHHFFECVGGEAQSGVLNKIIDIIQPGGTISALGVTEKKIELNVRMMLEKGLVLVGDSRSGVNDFQSAMDFMKINRIGDYLSGLVTNTVTVSDIANVHHAFEIDSLKSFGKTVMKWDI
ncbi:alcohol dehydrogenase catalytic domain-containing protein [Psychrobacillus sp. NPDC096623]|uniref:alcohol dehydrogenase catalytic domain-containing protein n=1 Tax=Psychrobacillus sp. NPDC096623 TaxID=3364492 RepID=UPI003807A322